jgi:diguanylate cyclase (GGDEF)-like protein
MSAAEPGDLRPVLDELMAETEEALAANNTFSAQLTEAGQVITALKTELRSQTSLARIDELTRLYNRRHFNFEAPQLMTKCEAEGQPVSIITFDLDYFKKINDTWGHNFGDKVLVVCAEIIRKAARVTDLAIRMGGEEFLLVCANLDLGEAFKVAERVRATIAETDITIRGQSLPVTVSAGVAQYAHGEDLLALLERADKALYRAKKEGRNTVRTTDSELAAQ